LQLFHIGGPRSGTEAQFPPPNDASKLRRSVASTTQQGKTSHPLTSELELTLVQASLLLVPEMSLLQLVAVAVVPELARSPSVKPPGLDPSFELPEDLLDKPY
jgi:hypothetical protein